MRFRHFNQIGLTPRIDRILSYFTQIYIFLQHFYTKFYIKVCAIYSIRVIFLDFPIK